jgi:hypothetical protein
MYVLLQVLEALVVLRINVNCHGGKLADCWKVIEE